MDSDVFATTISPLSPPAGSNGAPTAPTCGECGKPLLGITIRSLTPPVFCSECETKSGLGF
jgi:hypothetical protein